MFNRVVLFGDTTGIPQLLDAFPASCVKGIVVAGIRPQYIEALRALADEHRLPLFIQPRFHSLDYASFAAEFKRMNFDLLVCNCYSLIIRNDILESVNRNAVNVHWARLPFNRGPNPTQWALIKDERNTGVTIHYIEEGLDCGDVIFQVEEDITEADTWVTVNQRLRERSLRLLKEKPRPCSREVTAARGKTRAWRRKTAGSTPTRRASTGRK